MVCKNLNAIPIVVEVLSQKLLIILTPFDACSTLFAQTITFTNDQILLSICAHAIAKLRKYWQYKYIRITIFTMSLYLEWCTD